MSRDVPGWVENGDATLRLSPFSSLVPSTRKSAGCYSLGGLIRYAYLESVTRSPEQEDLMFDRLPSTCLPAPSVSGIPWPAVIALIVVLLILADSCPGAAGVRQPLVPGACPQHVSIFSLSA